MRRARGRFSQPLILPTPAYFPDPWKPDASGASAIARRLLDYAGLGRFEVVLETFETEERPFVEGERHTAAWFAGLGAGACRFGVDRKFLDRPAALAGAFAHEVAHAYRAHHGLVRADHDLEELLTDVTCFYLGFGVLSANAGYQYRVEHGVGASTSTWSKLGYLPVQALVYLLAVVARCRQLERKQLALIKRHLEPVQRGFFGTAMRSLADEDESLETRIPLPDRTAWPALRPIGAPLDLERNVGRHVGRTVQRFTTQGVWGGATVGLALAVGILSSARAPAYAALAALTLPVLGGILGSRFQKFVCGDPRCGTRLSAQDEVCPRCGGQVARWPVKPLLN